MKVNEVEQEEPLVLETCKPELTIDLVQTVGPLQGKVEVKDAIFDPSI